MKGCLVNRKLLWSVFAFYLVCVMFLCFYKFGEFFEVEFVLFGQYEDKICHFLMFFPFVPLLLLLVNTYSVASPKREKVMGCVVAAAVVFAFFTEIVQYFLPYRSFQWGDLLVDTISILLSWGAGVGLLRKKR